MKKKDVPQNLSTHRVGFEVLMSPQQVYARHLVIA